MRHLEIRGVGAVRSRERDRDGGVGGRVWVWRKEVR